MSKGKWNRKKIADEPAGVQQGSPVIPECESESPVEKTVEVSDTCTFKGTGTALVGGEIVAFRDGKFTTGSSRLVECLENAGFERVV